MRRPAQLAAVLAALAAAAPAGGVDINDGQLTIHGDGAWAYQRTTGQNSYADATPAGNYETAMFDLLLSARPVENLVISAQLGFEPDGAALQWAFAEWRFSERLRLRLGKVQQPFGNLNELRFAGTTRPFYELPYSAYGPGNVVGIAYYGAGATGQLISDSGWTLGYDLYLGAVNLEEVEPYAALADPPGTTAPVEPDAQQVRDLVGGRLSLSAPNEVTARLSGYAGRVQHADGKEGFYALGASLQYRGERLWLSVEAFGSREEDGEISRTAYATVGWMLTEHLQVAAQYEWARTTLPGSPSSPLLRHDALGLALAWWIDPSLAVKGCWTQVDGNRFAYPEGATQIGLVTPATAPSPHTGVLTLGTQFAF